MQHLIKKCTKPKSKPTAIKKLHYLVSLDGEISGEIAIPIDEALDLLFPATFNLPIFI